MNMLYFPPIARAAQSSSILDAALAYAELGMSVIPLQGKRPTVRWKDYQHKPASGRTISNWYSSGLLNNVGLVCGAVSGNLVVLDLDSPKSYPVLKDAFPNLFNTYTVTTGSGKGKHIYWRTRELPKTLRILNTSLGNLELRSEACLVVAPPSLHPKTHLPYIVERSVPIKTPTHLRDLVTWLKSFMPKSATPPPWQVISNHSSKRQRNRTTLDLRVLNALAAYFKSRGFKPRNEWLNGPCICPHRHRNGDIHPSFGYNTRSGFGYCFVCGTFLPEEVCEFVGINSTPYTAA